MRAAVYATLFYFACEHLLLCCGAVVLGMSLQYCKHSNLPHSSYGTTVVVNRQTGCVSVSVRVKLVSVRALFSGCREYVDSAFPCSS